ncbi:MAG: sensor histidine kinase [Patescibacteria group bacterium]
MTQGKNLLDMLYRRRGKALALKIFVFLVILLPVATVTIFSFGRLWQELAAREKVRRQTVIDRDNQFASALAQAVSIYVDSARAAVEVAANEAASRPLTPEGMRSLLTNMVEKTPAFFAASVGDAQGKAVLVFDPSAKTEKERYVGGFDLSGRAYYKQIVATRRPAVSDAITSLVNIQPTIAIAVPFFDADGRFSGFVAAGVSLEPLYQLALRGLGSEPASPTVIDRQGQVIVSADQKLVDAHARLSDVEPAKRVLRGEQGFLEAYVDADGEKRSAAYAPVPGLGWGVWIAQEPPTAETAFRDRQLRLIAIVYLAIFLANVAMAWLIWRLISEIYSMHQKESTFLDSIGDGVIAIDRYWNITLWNASAARLTGWSKDEVLGKQFRDRIRFIRERDRKENLAFIEEAMLFGEAKEMANNTLLLARDGREIPIGDSAAPIFDAGGRVTGVIIVFRDVSKDKEAHIMRTDFAYASHQFRTPINKALWNLELALESSKTPEVREAIRNAHRSIRDTHKLTERLIEVSQVDQKMIVPKFKPAKIMESIRLAAERVISIAAERDIKLRLPELDENETIDTDSRLFSLALAELLDNAVQYSREGGEVRIETTASRTELVIAVSDLGIGIPTEQQALIFTKFFRGQNVPVDMVGAGLGLFIAREYVRLLGGKLWFVSSKNEGTTFSIKLPRIKGMSL